jgi:hypothetical protein
MFLDPIETEDEFCPACDELLDEDGICPNDCDLASLAEAEAEADLENDWYDEEDDYDAEFDAPYYDDGLEDVLPGVDYIPDEVEPE